MSKNSFASPARNIIENSKENILRIDDDMDRLDELERDLASGWAEGNLFSGPGTANTEFFLNPKPSVNNSRVNTTICNSIKDKEERGRIKRALKKHSFNLQKWNETIVKV